MKRKHDLIINIIVPLIAVFWPFLYYKILYNNNMLISLDDISGNILPIFLQHIIVNLPVIIFLVISVKTAGRKKLFLNMPHGKIWKIVLALCVIIYCALLFYALEINSNIIKVLYTFVFYLLFVSFFEEYLCRGLLPFLQENKLPKVLEWILPNMLFTLTHYVMLFVEPSGISGIEVSGLIVFFITTMVFGIIMELLKRKSGSLFIPVLVHAIYDFYGEIMLWL